VSVALLEKYDRATAANILGAAALIAGDSPENEPGLVKEYGEKAQELLLAIRKSLKTSDAGGDDAQISVANYLTNEIQRNLFAEKDRKDALVSAGQAGRLNPVLYTVRQPGAFADLFYRLSLKPTYVEDAVKHPDDYQHLLETNASAASKGKLSIFLKLIRSARAGSDHWLLVQAQRDGLVQIAQSAWRIFPDVVELSDAKQPIDVLRAFVNVFGIEVNLGGITGKFIESIPVHRREKGVNFHHEMRAPFYNSASYNKTDDPDVVQVGAAYCIDIVKYAAVLQQKKFLSRAELELVSNAKDLVTTRLLT
jgi:hypothetical protein